MAVSPTVHGAGRTMSGSLTLRLALLAGPPLLLGLVADGCRQPMPGAEDPCAFLSGDLEHLDPPILASTCIENPRQCAERFNACLGQEENLERDSWWVVQVPARVQPMPEVKKSKPTLRAMAGSNTITPMHGRYAVTLLNQRAAEAWNRLIVENPQGYVERGELPYGSVLAKVNFTTEHEPPNPEIEGQPWLTVMVKIKDYERPTIGGSSIGGEWFYYLYRFGDFQQFDDNLVVGKPQAFCTDCHNPVSEHDFVWNLHLYLRARQDPYYHDPAPPGGGLGSGSAKPPANAPALLSPHDLCAGDPPQFGPSMPRDLPVDPATLSDPAEIQRMFDCFSWRSFLALNWPVDPEERGTPDPEAPRIDSKPGQPRVWESYKETAEVFQPQDRHWTIANQDWNDSQPVPEVCDQVRDQLPATARPKILQMLTKTRANQILNETHQAMGNQFNLLIDQEGRLIRYEVRFNRDEFEYFKANGFADSGNYSFDGPEDADVFFPTNVDGYTGDGSIEIKAAWRELCKPDPTSGECSAEEERKSAEYFHQTVLIYTPAAKRGQEIVPASCRVSRVGLAGLHLIRKTYLAPQWAWATFEHVDNVPPAGSPGQPGNRYLLYSPRCEGNTPSAEFCSQMRPGVFPKKKLEAMGIQTQEDPNCCPNAQLIVNAHPTSVDPTGVLQPDGREPLTKNQVTRLVPVGPSEMNQRFQRHLPKPWSNYFLINTQYPRGARQTEGEHQGATRMIPCNVRDLMWLESGDFQSAFVQAGIPKPDCYAIEPVDAGGEMIGLRNTTMETFQTAWNDAGTAQATQLSSQSCLNCHGFSGVDFSFDFLDAEEVLTPDSDSSAGKASGVP